MRLSGLGITRRCGHKSSLPEHDFHYHKAGCNNGEHHKHDLTSPLVEVGDCGAVSARTTVQRSRYSQGSNPSLRRQNAPNIHRGKKNIPRRKRIRSGGHCDGVSEPASSSSSCFHIRKGRFQSRFCNYSAPLSWRWVSIHTTGKRAVGLDQRNLADGCEGSAVSLRQVRPPATTLQKGCDVLVKRGVSTWIPSALCAFAPPRPLRLGCASWWQVRGRSGHRKSLEAEGRRIRTQTRPPLAQFCTQGPSPGTSHKGAPRVLKWRLDRDRTRASHRTRDVGGGRPRGSGVLCSFGMHPSVLSANLTCDRVPVERR